MRQKFSGRKFLAHNYRDLLVIGNGISAVEASLTAAEVGLQTMLISDRLDWLSAEPLGLEIDEETASTEDFYGTHFFALAKKCLLKTNNGSLMYLDELLLRKTVKEHLENNDKIALRQSIVSGLDFWEDRLFVKTLFGEEFGCRFALLELGDTATLGLIHQGLIPYGIDIYKKEERTDFVIDAKGILDQLVSQPIRLKGGKAGLARYLHRKNRNLSLTPLSPGFEFRIKSSNGQEVESIIGGVTILRYPKQYAAYRLSGSGKIGKGAEFAETIKTLDPPEKKLPLVQTLIKARSVVLETSRLIGCFT